MWSSCRGLSGCLEWMPGLYRCWARPDVWAEHGTGATSYLAPPRPYCGLCRARRRRSGHEQWVGLWSKEHRGLNLLFMLYHHTILNLPTRPTHGPVYLLLSDLGVVAPRCLLAGGVWYS